MPIFGICLFLIWFYFWIRGNIWAALVMAACPVILVWMGFTGTPNPWEHPLDHLDTNPYNWYFILIFFSGAFLPWYIHYRKARRIERALHGLRFMEAEEEPAPPPPKKEETPPKPQTLSDKIIVWTFIIVFGGGFLYGLVGYIVTTIYHALFK